jgi:putative nucleotidyltransferase with HDIG domain
MKDMTPYAGRWVALIGRQVVGVGDTAEEARQSVQHHRLEERAALIFVELAGGEPLSFIPLLDRLRPLLQVTMPVYLVGGAVRDALLGRISHDLDFVVPQDAAQLSFDIGDKLGAPAYVLDKERDTGRVVLADQKTMLDFARFRGASLEADLRARDFTINALAIPATAQTRSAIIDPTGGLRDLDAQRIRLTDERALTNDPVRTLRAVRLAASLDFTLTEETRIAVIAAVPRLVDVSDERVRDEILKILMTPRPDKAMREMEDLGLLGAILPEVAGLSDISQPPPHHEDVLSHTWSVLNWLERLETVLFFDSEGDAALDFAHTALETYLDPLRVYLERAVDGGLDGRIILHLAALFHDVGKQDTYEIDEEDRIRFFGHDEVGAELASNRLRQLCLSRDAISQVRRIVAGHMRPLSLAQAQGANPSRRAVFRYFRALDHNGLDIGLLALADHLATYDGPGDWGTWVTLVGLVAQLYQFYFERHEEAVKPVPLLNGQDLIDLFDMEPGPEIGRVLRLIEEGQAAGEIGSREEAVRFAQEQII